MNTEVIGYGAGTASALRICAFRWGGGAHPGKTHVFTMGPPLRSRLWMSVQCVVDDYGTLVDCETGKPV